MRIMTWNIHGARDASIGRLAAEIRALDPDVACLNEVRRGHGRRLARALGMRAFEAVSPVGPYGNAILTRDAVPGRRLKFAGVRRVDRRDAAIVTLPSGTVVACVHLNLRADERLRNIRELLAAIPDESVIAGDLNEGPHGPSWAAIATRFRDACAGTAESTFPAAAPRARLDGIWVPPRAIARHCRIVPTESSDHRAVVVIVDLGEQG